MWQIVLAIVSIILIAWFMRTSSSESKKNSTGNSKTTPSETLNHSIKKEEVKVEEKKLVKSQIGKEEEEEKCACGEKGKSSCCDEENSSACGHSETKSSNVTKRTSVKVLYGSQTGTCEEWAKKLAGDLQKRKFEVQVGNLATYDPDDLVTESVLIFVISTYAGGMPPENCTAFYHYLEDQSLDFREEKDKYKNLHYAVFGIGNSVYGRDFNTVAKRVDRMFLRLAGQRLVPVGLGDNGAGVEVIQAYSKWLPLLARSLEKLRTQEEIAELQSRPRKAIKTSEEADEDSEEEPEGAEPLADLEDLGVLMKKPKKAPRKKPKKPKVVEEPPEAEFDFLEEESDEEEEEEEEEEGGAQNEIKEMLTPSLRQALTKQGYKLLGSHSGVKLCRWTKAMLRGRGGCYKHTFYGISSFQCMEMTPSLACANKCVFCWRHHKNPVGKEWRWKLDEPQELVELAVKNHYGMIKQLKGIPGLVPERFENAMKIRHCALSLVGEPIIYPHINKFIELLHEKDISSFLVTNAQFPDKIENLIPVTQLYISVDAATKESLKKIDRPLFTDFWERFLSCIEALSRKGQRTVFRLTLVKEWNMEEIKNYAELIERGKPTFVEIKGVTYCGTSKASSLTMKNVPFHEEVRNFSRAILEASPYLQENYDLSCEHEHSCCILISDKRCKVDGVWHTWINYPKFHQLFKKFIATGETFTAFDYMEPTPSWALTGAPEKGFDPEETRFRRNKPYQKGGC